MTPDAAPAMPIFDGHNDALLRLWRRGDKAGASFLDPDAHPVPENGVAPGLPAGGHIDWPRARAGGLVGGLFATFVPDREGKSRAVLGNDVKDADPMPPVDQPHALDVTLAQAAILPRMARASEGRVRQCETVGDIEAAVGDGAMACVLHMEGAEAIDADLDALEVLYAAGLRSLGPVWSRPTIFATGAPFRFNATADDGPGLTDAGRALVAACNELGVMIDLSHMNEAGFWDVAASSGAPLVATHSNVHALSPSSRNLTDKQLDAIADSGGMVGLNFAVNFLREDGKRVLDTPLETMVRHLDHLVARLGEDGVGLGSDFEGAPPPAEIGDAAGLPRLVKALRASGWDDALTRKVCRDNWLRVLHATWKA